MAFTQFKLTKSINQSRDIFDKYIYESTTDSISVVTTPGYFDESRFSDEWEGSIIECLCSDGYIVGEISGNSISVLLTSNGGGSNPQNIIEVTSNYLVGITDDVVIGDGTFNITLPPVATAIKSLTIKSSIGGGILTVIPDGSEVIEGAATQVLAVEESITIVPTTTNDWEII